MPSGRHPAAGAVPPQHSGVVDAGVAGDDVPRGRHHQNRLLALVQPDPVGRATQLHALQVRMVTKASLTPLRLLQLLLLYPTAAAEERLLTLESDVVDHNSGYHVRLTAAPAGDCC